MQMEGFVGPPASAQVLVSGFFHPVQSGRLLRELSGNARAVAANPSTMLRSKISSTKAAKDTKRNRVPLRTLRRGTQRVAEFVAERGVEDRNPHANLSVAATRARLLGGSKALWPLSGV